MEGNRPVFQDRQALSLTSRTHQPWNITQCPFRFGPEGWITMAALLHLTGCAVISYVLWAPPIY